ncbi:MAG: aminotransferase class I/II-fold pyridoxal phosphate-dependent enzyme [Victivallales bacterium]|nr:aminotransferase class I/II-fold pyridoxal phosphate-dependent enzyme [Victivallales bacterium]
MPDKQKNIYTNNLKVAKYGNKAWQKAQDMGLIDLGVIRKRNKLITKDCHEFINMANFSYLGLDTHPKIVQGAAEQVLKSGSLDQPTARLRIHLSDIDDAEKALSELFEGFVLTASTCSALSEGVLPLIASGVFTDNQKPIMIFDRFCHFSMSITKPICADETDIITVPHNDLEQVEDICKKNKYVVYVADGAYSTGGSCPMPELLKLQEKYGLYLYIDDSHSISTLGKNGFGYARSHLNEINERTFFVNSMSKGFGCSGGMLLTGTPNYQDFIKRFGGPIAWSHPINSAGIGGILASVKIHFSEELVILQKALQKNLNFFDSLIKTNQLGSQIPIRIMELESKEDPSIIARKIFDKGFYVAPVSFPVVPKGKIGLRMMIRSNLTLDEIKQCCEIINGTVNHY